MVIRPIRLPVSSVNQRFPSGPLVIPNGPLGAGSGNSVIAPAVVMRPIWFASNSVNQRLASGPTVMKRGELDAVGRESHEPGRSHPPDPVVVLGKPEVAVRAGHDLDRLAEASRDRVLRDRSCRRDATDLPDQLRKPEVSVGADGDPARETPHRRHGELRQLATPSDASDPVPMLFGKPDARVRPCDDVSRRAIGTEGVISVTVWPAAATGAIPKAPARTSPGRPPSRLRKMASAMTLRHARDSEPRGAWSQPRRKPRPRFRTRLEYCRRGDLFSLGRSIGYNV